MTLPRIILASASPARAALLRGAGLTFEVIPAHVDETALRDHLVADGAGIADIAGALAEFKAATVARDHPDALVIGADQLLVLGHEIFSKPKDVRMAREHLQRLRGQTHELISAVALVRGDHLLWSFIDEARLHMRDFSNDFLENYLASDDPGLTESVGAYRLEGPGAQLFDRIEGDYFTVLGLPLLPLLDVLRQAGVVNP